MDVMDHSLFSYFLVFLGLYLVTNHLLSKIRNYPPSPFLCLPIIGHLYLLKKPLFRTLVKISARFGPVVLLRFGCRSVLVVASPSAAEECLSKNDVVFANRPRLLIGKHVGYNHTSLAWAPYGDHWRNLRKIASLEILSTHRLQMLSDIRSDEVRSLIRRLLPPPSSSTPDRRVDVNKALFELMLNVMMRMIAGKRYYGDGGAEVEEARRFREMVFETFQLSQSGLEDFLPVVRWVGLGREKRMIKLHEKREKFMQDLIEEQERKIKEEKEDGSEGKQKKTMIEVLLSLQKTDPDYYTDDIIKGMPLVRSASSSP